MRARCLWVVALVGLTAAPAWAAACCLSSSAFGAGRLASWETFAVVVNTSGSPVLGRWDETAAWRANAPGYSEAEWRAQLTGLVALHPRWQVNGRLPVVLTQKAAGGLSETGAGLGDSQLGVRFEPVFQGEYDFLPEFAVTAGVTIPSGRTTSASGTILGSDVTGRGAWALSTSLTAELARSIWFVQAGVGFAYSLPMAGYTPGSTQRFGLGWQGTVAGGVEARRGLVLSLVTRFGYEGPLTVDGAEVPGSTAYDFGLGPAVAYKLGDHWTLQGAVDVGVFASGLGENRQGRFTGSVGARYAYF